MTANCAKGDGEGPPLARPQRCHIEVMDEFRLRTVTLVVAAALIGLGVGLATGLFDGDGDAPPQTPSPTVADDASEPEGQSGGKDGSDGKPDLPRTEDDPQGLEPGPSGPAPGTEEEVAAARAAR